MTAAPRNAQRFDTSGSPVDVVIIVVTFRSEAAIGRLLESLRHGTGQRRTAVVVVDNASGDGTCDEVRAHEDVLLVEAGANIGYGAGINLGTAVAPPHDVVVVLNPDLVVDASAVDLLADQLHRAADVGIAVPALHDSTGTLSPSLRREPTLLRTLGDAALGARWPRRPAVLGEIVYDPTAYRSAHDVDWATGAAFAVSAICASAVGEWDERFFLYSEEVDFARRARAAGWRVRFVPDAVAVHTGGGSGSSPTLDALLAVSRVRYTLKHRGRVPASATWLALILGQLLRYRRSGAAIRLGLLTRPWRWSRLVTEGLGGRPAHSTSRPRP